MATVLGSLVDQGFVEGRVLLLTERGRERLQHALRLNVPPAAKTWQVFKRKYLPRLVLPSSNAGHFDPAMALLAEQLQSPSALPKSPATLVNAWLSRTLGVRSAKMTLDGLRAALLARELGVPVRPTLEQVTRLGAAKLAGAAKGTSDDLVRALTARWLSGEQPITSIRVDPAAPLAAAARKNSSEPTVNYALVKKVRAAVKAPSARRFGEDKVFISSVWDLLHSDPEVSVLGEAGFKRALVEAHRDGALVLSRADLVAAMDPADVAASETRHLNATYHFIQMQGDR